MNTTLQRPFDEIAYIEEGHEVIYTTYDGFAQLAEKGVLSELFYKHAMMAAQFAEKSFEDNAPSPQEFARARINNETLVDHHEEPVHGKMGQGKIVFYKIHNYKVDPRLN